MHLDFPQSFCRAGVARRDITPPVGIYHRMWGAATHECATGVHRPLTATALVIEPDGQPPQSSTGTSPQVLVSIDHCLLWNEDMQRLQADVCSATGLRPDQLQIAFTHTHAAGLMDPSRANLPGGDRIAPYLKQMAQHIGEAIAEARKKLQPARMVYGTGRCGLAGNRDFWDADSGQFVCGLNPAGPTDDTVLIARVADVGGGTLAVVVNYACHPTTLAWENTLISPDYVGAMRDVVERATGGLCLFLQGASGDLGPRHGYVGDVEVADRNGRELGYAVLAALESLPHAGLRFEYSGPVVSGATLGRWDYRPLEPEVLCEKHGWRCEQFTVDLPYRADLPSRDDTEVELARWTSAEREALDAREPDRARDARANAERMTRQLARLRSLPEGPTVPVTVSLWRLGDAYWIFVQGEHYHVMQRRLRERFAGCPLVVTTVTNGWRPGYVPARETYGRGLYQESIAVVAPGALETLIDAIGDRLAAWRKS
ncbi:MAG: neutral/alkaline non-lysosomal ceramidase N-terminal domain-containing protein [Pirellulales bacterium]